ncbi:hypothetical protein [Bradyrhizobium sp. McL0615]|uniref:hypothetical protein n=1 Tax=Bradyrhizobium sp. McL0615 TaxID=3415673 RepID=UPI003CEEC550
MDIDRRKVLAGSFCLALESWTGNTVVDLRPGIVASMETTPWHPLTRSLLDRAQRANAADGRANTASIERTIRDVARVRGCANPPVIKWRTDPFEAYAYLSQLGLDELLQMNNAQLWCRAGPKVELDDDRLNSAAVLGGVIGDTMRSSDHDRLLMAPKLFAKARAGAENASAEAVFKVRAVAAQVGWLETCLPVVAAQAVIDIELLLSSGASKESIHHQLRVFEAYELGLLATWETPGAIVCVAKRDLPNTA